MINRKGENGGRKMKAAGLAMALAAFALVSAALVVTGLKAVSPENGKKRKEN